MIVESMKELHNIHVQDYINLFNKEDIEYSIIVKTKNITVISSKKIKLEELFDEYISIKFTKKLKENTEFMPKSLNIKTDTLNDIKIDCNLLIRYYNVQTFAIDNRVIYICNIDEETENKIRLQEHCAKIATLREN